MEPSVCNGHDRVCVAEVNVNSSCHGEEKGFDNSTHNSRLECVEPCQDYLPTEDCMDVDEDDEFDDFDPYLFISNLPDLSTVVPTFRHMLLPKQTRSCPSTTLVLDLDGMHLKFPYYINFLLSNWKMIICFGLIFFFSANRL